MPFSQEVIEKAQRDPDNPINKEILRRVAEQTPEAPEVQQEEPEKKEPFLKRAAEFFVGKAGETLGDIGAVATGTTKEIEEINATLVDSANKLLASARKETDPVRKKRLFRMASENFQLAGEQFRDILPSSVKTKKQIFGEFATAGLSASVAGKLGVSAKTLIPNVLKGLSATKYGRAAEKIIPVALEGSAFAGASSLGEGKTGEELMKDIRNGAILGSAFRIVPGAMSKSATKLMDKVFTKSSKQKLLDIQGKSADAASTMLNKKTIGTRKQLLNQVSKHWDKTDKTINDIIDSKTELGVLPAGNMLNGVFSRTIDDFDGNINPEAVISVFKKTNLPFFKLQKLASLPKDKLIGDAQGFTVKEANKLRSIIDNKYIGNSKWMNSSPETLDVAVLKNTANVLREVVQATDDRLPKLFNDSQGLIVARELLQETISSKKGLVSTMVDSGLFMGGLTGGLITQDLKFPAILAGIGAGKSLLQSGVSKSIPAVALKGASKLAEQAPRKLSVFGGARALTQQDEEQQ